MEYRFRGFMIAFREIYQPKLPFFLFSYPSLYLRAQCNEIPRWLSCFDVAVFMTELATDKGHQHGCIQNKRMQKLHCEKILLYR